MIDLVLQNDTMVNYPNIRLKFHLKVEVTLKIKESEDNLLLIIMMMKMLKKW